MNISIYLEHQFLFGAVKINDVSSNAGLQLKFELHQTTRSYFVP